MKKYLLNLVVLVGLARVGFCADSLPLVIATQDYPHIDPILNGTVIIPECRIHYSTRSYATLNHMFDQGSAGDVIEVDLISYLKRFSTEETHDWILVPVFLWREFPQRHILINTESALSDRNGLKGKKIGIDHPNLSLEVWVKGIIKSSSALPTDAFLWDKSLSTSTTPHRALFSDSKTVEQEYFKETRIFPIITVLALRNELVKANPWLPEALFIAFSEAKSAALKAGTIPLPWGQEARESTIELMGKNYWSYGVKNNPKTLGALFKFAKDQGVIKQDLEPRHVFAGETLQLIDEKGAKN